jgi:hypothetical protein
VCRGSGELEFGRPSMSIVYNRSSESCGYAKGERPLGRRFQAKEPMQAMAIMMFLFAIAPFAGAQEARLSATVGRSSHGLFSSPSGFAVGGALQLVPGLSARLTYHLLDDNQSRIGRACAWPEPPACPEEPMDDVTELNGFTLGLVATISQRGKLSVAFVPEMSFVSIKTTSTGRQTGGIISDGGTPMFGWAAGVEVHVAPKPEWPVSLHAAGRLTWLDALGDPPADGYSPFAGDLALTNFEIGFAVGRRSRR